MRKLLFAFIVVLLISGQGFPATEIYQGSAGNVYCSYTADTAPFDSIGSGSTVVRMEVRGQGGADDGEYWTGSAWQVAAATLTNTELTFYRGGLWLESVTPSSDMTGVTVSCFTSDSTGIPYDYSMTVFAENRWVAADEVGTNSALLASSAPTNFGDLAITATTGQVTVGQDESWYLFNVVDLTNESGDQNPTTTSFDSDAKFTVDVTSVNRPVVLYFPTTEENSNQDVNCNLQGVLMEATGYNTATKVWTVETMPAAPDYRCVVLKY